MKTIKHTIAAITLFAAPALFAQTYIVANGDCGDVKFVVSRGNAFPTLGEAIASDRVVNAYVIVPKQRAKVKLPEGATPLTFEANISDTGVTMASVDLKPEIVGNETRTDHAKAMIFCGAKTPMADWQLSASIGLEIYPQGWNGPRPSMKAGEPMRFIVVKASPDKMLDLPMQLYGEGSRLIADGTPASGGGMNFPYQEPGRYMVMTTDRRADPQHAGQWLVDTSTLVFDIK